MSSRIIIFILCLLVAVLSIQNIFKLIIINLQSDLIKKICEEVDKLNDIVIKIKNEQEKGNE